MISGRPGRARWRFRRILHFHSDSIGKIGAPRLLEPHAIEEPLAMAARALAGLEIFKDKARAVALQKRTSDPGQN
jgi:hypothetical protein